MNPKLKALLAGASLVGASVVGLTAIQSPAVAQSANATTNYRAALLPLPNTMGQGTAMLRLSADQRTLTVKIKASGLEPGVHVSHIHGLGTAGQPGPILIDFKNIDPNKDGVIEFTKTIMLSGSEAALPLVKRHIVIHGMTVGAVGAGTPGEVDGTAGYKTLLPVLCGEIESVGGGKR